METLAKRRVRVRYSFEIETEVPADWEQDSIEFWLNGSSSCADNRLDELVKHQENRILDGDCLCSCFKGEYLGEVG